jgi:DeoR/GlpR family transcriptional regulator of sugar metabolism
LRQCALNKGFSFVIICFYLFSFHAVKSAYLKKIKNMLPTHRRDKILELLQEDGSAKVLDLARLFKVTEVTIRQDLEKLEKDGLILREHGGAYLKNIKDQVQTFSLTHKENLDKKELIAGKCLEFIESGDTIILDSGSTNTEVAKKLKGMKNLTVITNALNIALMLGAEPGIEVIVTGGEFKPPTLSLTGQKAADFFKGLNVQKLFLATAGISLKSGLTYPSISDLVVKKAMIEAAETRYLVADSTKIGKTALASLGALSLIDYIITDPGIEEKHKQVFYDNEIELIIASNKNEK